MKNIVLLVSLAMAADSNSTAPVNKTLEAVKKLNEDETKYLKT